MYIAMNRIELPQGVDLLAVSKYQPDEKVFLAYEEGQRRFGESHVQDMVRRYESMPKDIEWHFIGHLQTNKVKQIVPFVNLIHSVDSPHLLAEFEKQASRIQRVVPCLLQLHVAQEDTKFGFSPEEAFDFLCEGSWKEYSYARIVGVMCMASNTKCKSQIAAEFDTAYQFFLKAKKEFFPDEELFSIRSWGMSNDYEIAVQHGANLVRIGTLLFK